MEEKTFPEEELKKITREGGINSFGSICEFAIRYIYTIFISRILGADKVGIFFLGVALLKFMDTIARMGLRSGIVRFVALYTGKEDKERTKGTILDALKIGALVSALVSILIFISSEFISISLFKKALLAPILKIFSLTLPFYALMFLVLSAIQGFKNLRYVVYTKNILQPLLAILLAFLFTVMGFRLIGITVGFSISFVIGLGVGIYYLFRVFPELKERKFTYRSELYPLMRFSLPLFLVGVLMYLMGWIDTIMLGYFRSSSEVGIYNAGLKTAMVISFFLPVFNMIFAPFISDLSEKNEIEQIGKLFKVLTRWVFTLSMGLFLFIVLFRENILSLFGRDFKSAGIVVIVLGIGQIINVSTGSVGLILSMSGKQDIELINTIFVTIVNIILNVILIPIYGITGAAIATASSISLVNIMRLLEVYLFYRIHPYNLLYLKPLLAGFISILVIYILHSIFYGWLKMVIFLVIYGLTLRIAGFSKEDRLLIHTLDYLVPLSVRSRL